MGREGPAKLSEVGLVRGAESQETPDGMTIRKMKSRPAESPIEA